MLGRVGRHQASSCEEELKVWVEGNSVWLGLCPSNFGHEVRLSLWLGSSLSLLSAVLALQGALIL